MKTAFGFVNSGSIFSSYQHPEFSSAKNCLICFICVLTKNNINFDAQNEYDFTLMGKRRLKKAIKRIKHLPKNKYFFRYIFNKLKHFYYKLVRSKKVAYPSTIMIELTNHCNLHCTTCPREYDYGKQMDKGYIQLSRAKQVIDELWTYLDSIGLTGMGETFLYKEIREIAAYIKSKNKGIIISVSTNAMIPDFIDKLLPLIDLIDTVQISIDGLGEVYNNIRLNADFNTLDNNLKQLVSICRGTETVLMLNMVVTKENYFQMYDLVKYANEIGIKYMNFTSFNLAAVTNISTEYYQFYNSDKFINAFNKAESAKKDFPEMEITNWDFKSKSGFRKCPLPWTHFYICWNGYVAPCCAKPFPKELNFGNVFESGVMNVLNAPSFQSFRKLWYKNITPDFCRKCHFVDL